MKTVHVAKYFTNTSRERIFNLFLFQMLVKLGAGEMCGLQMAFGKLDILFGEYDDDEPDRWPNINMFQYDGCKCQSQQTC